MSDLWIRFPGDFSMCGKCTGSGFVTDYSGNRIRCNRCGGTGSIRNRSVVKPPTPEAKPAKEAPKSLLQLQAEARLALNRAVDWIENNHRLMPRNPWAPPDWLLSTAQQLRDIDCDNRDSVEHAWKFFEVESAAFNECYPLFDPTGRHMNLWEDNIGNGEKR